MRRIVDAHHHLWNVEQNPYPWFNVVHEDRGWGDMSALMQNYLPQHLYTDAQDAGWEIVKSVHVQANWDPNDPVGESRWLQSLAEEEQGLNLPTAIVGWVDLSADSANDVLWGHAECSRVRGVRQVLNRHSDPRLNRAPKDFLNDPMWLMNFSRLAGLNLSFDAQIYSHQASDLARLASENPDTTIILDHAGMPHDQSAEGLSEWRSAVEQLAEMPNICIKISGFGMVDNQWTPDSVVPLIRHCVDSFGCKRSMFGSNFPVDKLMSSWDRLWQTFALSVKDKSKDEQEWMFSRTAETVYRI